MNLPPPPIQGINQDAAFYSYPWLLHIENTILGDIVDEKERGLWVYGDDDDNCRCLERISREMERNYRIFIPFDAYVAKVNQWQSRYNNFSTLLDTYMVEHDEETNNVHASEQTWRQIQATRPELLCYYNSSEYNWALLKRIFTPPPNESRSDSYGSYVSVESPSSTGTWEYPTIFP